MNLTKINLKSNIRLMKRGKSENLYWVPRESDLWEVLYSYYVDMPDTSLTKRIKRCHNDYVVQFNLIARNSINGFRGICIDAYDSMGMSSDVAMEYAVSHEGFYFKSSPKDIMSTLMPDKQIYHEAIEYAYANWIL